MGNNDMPACTQCHDGVLVPLRKEKTDDSLLWCPNCGTLHVSGEDPGIGCLVPNSFWKLRQFCGAGGE